MEKWKRKLQSIGKRTFVNCFEEAYEKQGVLSVKDIFELDPEYPARSDGKGVNTKKSCIKNIFNNEKLKYPRHALADCAKSCKGSSDAWEKAKILYKKYYPDNPI